MKRRIAPVALVALGLAQMLAVTLDIPVLRGLAAATAASPAPRVFTSMDGFEGFSTRFTIEYRDVEGRERSLDITPQRYARVRGAYNRRNAYGAVIAGGPVLSRRPLTRPMYEAVSRYAVCGEAPLLRELGVDPETVASPISVRYTPRAGVAPPDGIPLFLTVECP